MFQDCWYGASECVSKCVYECSHEALWMCYNSIMHFIERVSLHNYIYYTAYTAPQQSVYSF